MLGLKALSGYEFCERDLQKCMVLRHGARFVVPLRVSMQPFSSTLNSNRIDGLRHSQSAQLRGLDLWVLRSTVNNLLHCFTANSLPCCRDLGIIFVPKKGEWSAQLLMRTASGIYTMKPLSLLSNPEGPYILPLWN